MRILNSRFPGLYHRVSYFEIECIFETYFFTFKLIFEKGKAILGKRKFRFVKKSGFEEEKAIDLRNGVRMSKVFLLEVRF